MASRSNSAFPARSGLVGWLLLPLLVMTACAAASPAEDPEILVVGGLDYTFDLPSRVPSGPVEISFENRGEVRHELILVRLRPGVTLAQLSETVVRGEDRDPLVERTHGILAAEPGEPSLGRLVVDLTPGGTYALICTFRDTPDDPTHVALGMIRTFEVAEAAE